MITPQEIKKQCLGWWKELLLSTLEGESYFPKTITRIGKITSKDILLKLAAHKAAIAELQQSATAWGYEIAMEEKRFDKIGAQMVPTAICIPSLEVYLRITRKRSELDTFVKNSQLILTELPVLSEWCKANPLRLISHNSWQDTLKVCRYFLANPSPNLYIRELPIDIHTKYIEENKEVIKSLLDTLLPPASIATEEKSFEKRYGLKCAEPLIRIRFLDDALIEKNGWSDISIPLPHFLRFPYKCEQLFVTENKMNFLTLPPLPNSIAVWSGGGFNISYLKKTAWIKELKCYYWGDLDAQGMQILNQFRSYYPQVTALMMDWDTLRQYEALVKSGTPTTIQQLPHLTEEEYALYLHLQKENLRLEQEQIPQREANKKVENGITPL